MRLTAKLNRDLTLGQVEKFCALAGDPRSSLGDSWLVIASEWRKAVESFSLTKR
jgi:hypothetical protein